MKRTMMALMVGALLCTGAQAQAPGEALGFAVMEQLARDGQGALISPWGLALSLSMAREGAAGDTLHELNQMLGDKSVSPRLAPGVTTAAVALYDPRITPLESFEQALTAYGARLMPGLDQGAVNQWVKEATNGMIDPLLTDALPEDTRLALISAIALDQQWAAPFLAEDTYEGVFHAPQGDARAQFMHRSDAMDYGEMEGLQLMRLPYKGGDLGCYLILPQQGNLDEAMALLRQQGYALFDGLADAQVYLALPKLALEQRVDLTDTLAQLGLQQTMSDAADFSGIDGTKDLKLGMVVQATRLDVDEEGTRAASATAAFAMAKSAFVEDVKDMIFDRPFILLIRDELGGHTLFAACVVQPDNRQLN